MDVENKAAKAKTKLCKNCGREHKLPPKEIDSKIKHIQDTVNVVNELLNSLKVKRIDRLMISAILFEQTKMANKIFCGLNPEAHKQVKELHKGILKVARDMLIEVKFPEYCKESFEKSKEEPKEETPSYVS